MKFEVLVDEELLRLLRQRMQKLSRNLNDSEYGLKKFVKEYLNPKTQATFEALRRGGTYRGVEWADFEASTLGRVLGTHPTHGRVFSNKRSSGRVISDSSSLLDDTGALKGAATNPAIRISRNKVTIQLTSEQQKGIAQALGIRRGGVIKNPRPFLFFELPKDQVACEEFILEYWLGKGYNI